MEQAYEDLKLVWDAKAELGEGPCWDHRSGRLIWVDVLAGRIHFYDPAGGDSRTIRLDRKVGAVVPRLQGGLVLALDNGFHTLDLQTEQLTPLADPESDLPGNRFNDGKCDPAGRFWAGTMDMKEESASGSLYCLNVSGPPVKAASNVTVSNGMDWSLDLHTMYYIDSPTRRVMAYDYDLNIGCISRPRVAVEIPEGEGFPDGMTIDAEGMLWIAQWGGWQVGRYDPATGAKLGSIPVPAAHTTSCAFGGDHLDELYITTARIGLNEEESAQQPHAGGLFRIKPGVKGRAGNFYGG
jgi:sugar lactone lactonase YvrE